MDSKAGLAEGGTQWWTEAARDSARYIYEGLVLIILAEDVVIESVPANPCAL